MGRSQIALALTTLIAVGAAGGIWPAWSQTGQQHSFSVSLSGGVYPIVIGTTNIPDGTELFVNLKKPWLPDAQQRMARGLAACGDDCFPATGPNHQFGIFATVRDGSFVAGQFSFNGVPFQPGAYPLEISLSADPKTATIEQIHVMGTVVFAATVKVPGDQRTYRQDAAAAPNEPTRSAALIEYEAAIAPFQRAFAITFVASICQVRSDAYFAVFREARQAVFERELAQHRLSSAEWQTAEADLNRVYRDAQLEIGFRQDDSATLPKACQNLWNNPKLDELDELERRLVGNYH